MFLKLVRGDADFSSSREAEHRQELLEKIVSNLVIALAIFFVSFFFTLSILDFLL
ncbi:hypothetical protein [Azospirillum sp. TSO22-1]|uniref:hypothetical protein n=1 Tax=Azospirillum sp. TSO22-1 TaxID=716789 RepID=UPI001304F8D3|nr:hypothetical protein [Azospirillum sp. TSO22-1]